MTRHNRSGAASIVYSITPMAILGIKELRDVYGWLMIKRPNALRFVLWSDGTVAAVEREEGK